MVCARFDRRDNHKPLKDDVIIVEPQCDQSDRPVSYIVCDAFSLGDTVRPLLCSFQNHQSSSDSKGFC